MGESTTPRGKLRFDRRIRLEFHGATITSDAGLLARRPVAGRSLEKVVEREALHPIRAPGEKRNWASGRATTYESANELGILPPLDAGSDKGNLTRKHYAAGEDELHGLLDSEVCLQDFSLWYEG